MAYSLHYTANELDIEVKLPASKSESNRLLILHYLSNEAFQIEGLSEAQDTQILQACLTKIRQHKTEDILELDCQEGGTQLRFLMALCAMLPGKFLLTGSERLMDRPQLDLVESLREIGAGIANQGEGNKGPWLIDGGFITKDSWKVSMARSSQFASALLLVAPFMNRPVQLTISEPEASWPYVEMTLKTLQRIGVRYTLSENVVQIYPGINVSEKVEVEADWSSAAFFYVAQAMRKKGSLLLKNLKRDSIQGDAFIENLMRYEGIISNEEKGGIRIRYQEPDWKKNDLSINLINYPDLAPALVAYYLSQGRSVNWSGLESLKGKESKRDEVLEEMLAGCGASLKEEAGHWIQQGSIVELPELLATHDDHRMAMAFALLAFRAVQIRLSEIKSVSKSFPGYWDEMKKLGLVEFFNG